MMIQILHRLVLALAAHLTLPICYVKIVVDVSVTEDGISYGRVKERLSW